MPVTRYSVDQYDKTEFSNQEISSSKYLNKRVSSKKNLSVPQRKKGIWEDLTIHNTPEQLNNALSFKSEIKGIISCQLNISKSIEKLKDDYYL